MRKLWLMLVLVSLGLLVGGCNSSQSGETNVPTTGELDSAQYEQWLKADATEAFNKALDRDYRRLTVISGSLNMLNSSSYPELELGHTLGALEATIFVQEYEYTRLDNNINLTPEIKRDIVLPGLLTVLYKNHKLMDHVYHDILKPYSELVKKKQVPSVEQEKAIEKTKRSLADITNIYSRLCEARKNTNAAEIEALVTTLEKSQTELSGVFFPTLKPVNKPGQS